VLNLRANYEYRLPECRHYTGTSTLVHKPLTTEMDSASDLMGNLLSVGDGYVKNVKISHTSAYFVHNVLVVIQPAYGFGFPSCGDMCQ
jgi:hypothetical protein